MKLYCDITLPSSKSESNRALMIAAYGGFPPDIQSLSESRDTQTLLEALRGLAPIDSIANPSTHLRNDIGGNPRIIDIADCGTAARFLTTYLVCREGNWLLTGTERMRQRPMAPLVDALRILGSDIMYVGKEGFLPLLIQGKPISGRKASIDMSQSSQFASSLLLAAPTFPQGIELELLGELSSLPYLDMTLAMMRHFGAKADRKERLVMVEPHSYQPTDFKVSADWSAASYWYEMAAFSEECEIRLHGLCGSSTSFGTINLQGDAVIAEWMKPLGVGSFIEGEDVVLRKIPFKKQPLHFDFFQHPDLYPTIVATCAGLNIEADFTGLDNLAHKESNRVEAMQMELAKLDNCPIHFSAHDDHRIVMALAPLSMVVGEVSFNHPEAVEKSYPNYWRDVTFLPIV